MGANVFPVDAVSGAPNYTAQTARQTLSVHATKSPGRLLGARGGVNPATPATTVTATSSTWTVLPHTGLLDTEAPTVAGPYMYSFDSNQTGSVNAADATNPRIDLLSVQVSDPAEGDGTSTPGVAIVYTAGTAAASPSPPSTPTRSMALAQISVPKSGGGSPSVALVAPWAVAAGASIPVRTQAERDALTAYTGLTVIRLDQKARRETYDGAAWRGETTCKQFTGTTDGSGFLTVTHSLGWTPVSVNATPNSPITSGTSSLIFASALTDTFTSTTFRVRAINAVGGQMSSVSITISVTFG